MNDHRRSAFQSAAHRCIFACRPWAVRLVRLSVTLPGRASRRSTTKVSSCPCRLVPTTRSTQETIATTIPPGLEPRTSEPRIRCVTNYTTGYRRPILHQRGRPLQPRARSSRRLRENAATAVLSSRSPHRCPSAFPRLQSSQSAQRLSSSFGSVSRS